MLSWTFIFLVLALIAGVFGFTGISIISVDIARIAFFLFLVGAVIGLIFDIARKGSDK